MKIEKRDSAGKRTLTVVCDKEAEITYMSEMLLNNRIPYLIAPVRGLLNGREMLLYDLSGYVSLEDHLKEKK